MKRTVNRTRALVVTLWRADRPLTFVGLLMLAALGASVAGMALDPRTITGAPAWLKPAKFAASTAIYALTLAWIFTYLPAWPRTRRVVGWTTAVVLALEVGIIDLQAWRGTTSHFNVSTPLDLTLWTTMGAAIVLQTLASIAVVVALWRQSFADRALGWALRLGFAITVVGALSGGLMTAPTGAQLTAARETGRMTTAGAHTVGGPDGGPGLPGTGWSREHGDLRVPHFLGLHAVQFLPLAVFALGRRRWPEPTRVRLTWAAAGSYSGLFVLLVWQALRGQPVTSPDGISILAFAAWALITTIAVRAAASRRAAPTKRSAGIVARRSEVPRDARTV